MNLISYWVVGFAGNRNVSKPNLVRQKLREALAELQSLVKGSQDDKLAHQWVAISSAAIGCDLLFIEEAKALDFQWIAVLPFPEDIFFNERDFPDPDVRTSAREIVAKAADREIVAVPHARAEITDSSWRHTAFADAGFRCADEADVFIAVIDESTDQKKPGGTSQTVHYMRARKRPMIIINPETGEVRKENWRVNWRDNLIEDLAALPLAPLSEEAKGRFPTPGSAVSAEWRNTFAAAARKYVPGIRRSSSAVVILHALATIITALVFLLLDPVHLERVGNAPAKESVRPADPGLAPQEAQALGKKPALPAHESTAENESAPKRIVDDVEIAGFAFVLVGFCFLAWLQMSHPHAHGASYRLAAEIGRSLLAVWNIPEVALTSLQPVPHSFRHFVRSMLLCWRLDPARARVSSGKAVAETEVRKAAADYLRERICPQIRFYRDRHRTAVRSGKILEAASILLSFVAVVSAGILAFDHPHENVRAWFGFAKLFTATAAPVMVSLLVIHEVKRREARYHEMIHLLREHAALISQTRSFSRLRHLIVDLERIFLGEAYDWWILAKENVAA